MKLVTLRSKLVVTCVLVFLAVSLGVASFSPYRNGSYLIPLTAHGASGWILYCSCRMPPASSQWGSTDLKPYEIRGQAYRRGYGSPEEVWDVTRDSRVDPLFRVFRFDNGWLLW
jgi:hypothetical protein